MTTPAPLPPDETERLRAVHACALLDTPSEGAFDDITELVARVLQVPIALVTVVDESRQWFKSRFGLGLQQTPREVSFCAHAILAPGQLFEVPDALADPRFADNPLVTGEPFIRFYAGMPMLTSGGFALGTLAVIDRAPRRLDDDQRRLLGTLAHQVAAQVELRQLAAKLREARDAALRANRAKSEFVARLSHELRTPLNAVMGFAELLQQEHARVGDMRQAQWAQHIHRAGAHLLDLVSETMDLARIESGAMPVTLAPLELGDSLSRLPSLVQKQAEQAGVEVRFEAAPTLPRVLADRMRLDQILINLLSNAIKYNRRGGRVLLRATADDDADHLRIEVRDTGQGLDATQLASLFQPFNRLGAERGPIEGSGLGLALAQRLALLMDGELDARSEPGVGSTFTLRLRRA